MSYGRIEYSEDGLPKCEICNQYFKRVLSHVRQKHGYSEKEYKKEYGFDLRKGICSKESSDKTRVKTLENYDLCVTQNLEEKGAKNRFKKGSKGRPKEKVSAQTKIRLKQRLKEPYMVAAMKESGKKVGKSGLGNKVRWEKVKLVDNKVIEIKS
ncbi:MAG: hypothetical protein WC026_13135 [Hyphomicrobium sp.]|uniref:hypothetical protein n=1 Tax=Hyphomicrobium sp. TaxID=82 RepID=UPI003561EA13